jgi:hypothetical protein
MVRRAWEHHCAEVQADVADSYSYKVWYRTVLQEHFGLTTTAGATVRQLESLIAVFTLLAGAGSALPGEVLIQGWTPTQNVQFNRLVVGAWRVAQSRGQDGVSFDSWVDSHLSSVGLKDRFAPDRTESFDTVMSAFAVIAGDEYWISRTSFASEIRMRWVIRNLLVQLSEVTGLSCDWSYARGIYSQMSLPLTIDETPSLLLRKVLQALDTHVRRLSL